MSKRNSNQLTSLSASLRARSTLIYIVVGLLSLLSLFPFFYMFMNSTWSNFEILSALRLYPGRLSQLATNIANLNARSDFSFPIGFKNSFIISTAATALTVYFSALTAYGIKVYNFKLRNAAFVFIMVVLMVPPQVSITGFVKLMMQMNLFGTKWPLIIPAIAAPAVVFFIKQYLDSALSMEVIEASRIDGASEFYTFNRICLPIMVPALATQAIFGFIASWNNYFTPSIILSRMADKTMPLMVSSLYSDRFTDFGQIYTGLSITVLPLIVVFFFLQRYIIQGVSAGSVKE
jgi:multiple sugar transport system permease protein